MIDWRHWHNEPYLVGGLVLLGWLYAILAGPFRGRLAPERAFPTRQSFCYYAALVLFYLAVGSPLDQIGERFLFSAHMLQHQLLIYPAAILFLCGLPSWMVDPALSRPSLRPVLQFITRPLIAALIFILVMSLWHMPFLYEWALQNKLVHVGEHLMFFAAALVYWWPLLSPSKLFPPAPHGSQMLYVFGVTVGMVPVSAFLIFSDNALYPTYEYAPRLFASFPADDDQLLAGTMMEIIGLVISMATFGWSFYRWHLAGERANGTIKKAG
jgi:putative membrane protein